MIPLPEVRQRLTIHHAREEDRLRRERAKKLNRPLSGPEQLVISMILLPVRLATLPVRRFWRVLRPEPEPTRWERIRAKLHRRA
jgi:hypothetical protein